MVGNGGGESIPRFVLLNLHHQSTGLVLEEGSRKLNDPWGHLVLGATCLMHSCMHACIPSSSDTLAEARVHPAVGSRPRVSNNDVAVSRCFVCYWLTLSAMVKKRTTHLDEAGGGVHGWWVFSGPPLISTERRRRRRRKINIEFGF
ncbi:hypothetical protein B296_00034913 [Ensete ventricosum]|uniref:Uncharacterized protein n=1 Tax=Ensete ventricosum TaxID=4639 RepID=A0A426X9D6_ENSVE|nr:hypothetical protein B296_00034913 [Ensete ventricosum]